MERSLTEIARLCQRSERTIRRWMDEGVLTVSRLPNGMYEIAEDEIAKKRGPGDIEVVILQHLASIEQRLTAIEEAIRAGPVKHIAPPSPAQRPLPAQPEPGAVPPGSIHLRDLVAQLGINRTTLYGHVKSGKYQAISLPRANRPGEYDHYFAPEEAARIRADYGK